MALPPGPTIAPSLDEGENNDVSSPIFMEKIKENSNANGGHVG